MSKTAAEQAAEADAAKKAASDEAARKAALEAGDDDDDDLDDSKLSPEAKAQIEKLRKENAKYRTKARELETKHKEIDEKLGKFEKGLKALAGGDDGLTPEQKLEKLTKEKAEALQEKEQLAYSAAMKAAAIEHGVNKDNFEYFEFLVGKATGKLKDGEEISEKELAEIAKQAKAKTAPKTTSVGGDKNTPPPTEDDGDLTLEDFQAMGIVKRSVLYQKDPTLYEKMVNAEKAAKKAKK